MVRRSILSSVREEQPANAESVEPVQEPILQPVSRVKRKRVVLAVWTGLVLVGILPSGHSGGVHLGVRWMVRIPQ